MEKSAGQRIANIKYDDLYWNIADGAGEKGYIFVEGNRLKERWSNQSRFVIGELGFGLGLSFLVTLKRWREVSSSDQHLLYFSCDETYPLIEKQDLAFKEWPAVNVLWEEIRASFLFVNRDNDSNLVSIELPDLRTTLIISICDVVEALQIFREQNEKIDAWYFDGFSPDKNPAMWSREVFSRCLSLSADKATFSTYSSARIVKDNLSAAGWRWEKREGFGGKREMLIGAKF